MQTSYSLFQTIVETNENSDSFLGSMEENQNILGFLSRESKTRSAKKLEEEKENLVVNSTRPGSSDLPAREPEL